MPTWLVLLTITLLGLCIGSFLNVCAYRLPLGESVVHPRSRCTSCGRMLTWFDNLPVVSWVVLAWPVPHLREASVVDVSQRSRS